MKVKLQKYIDKYGDGIHGTPAYDENGEYYFVNGNNLENGKVIINNDTLKITQEEYEKIKRPLTSNTILLSINGSLGKIAIYNNEKIALGKSACYLNVKENENKYFVKYVLSTDSFKKYMNLVAHGSTIKNLAPSQVVEYEFEEPKNRDKVAFILKKIDDKIYNNNKIISELESMAKTIYDYWFLQYEFPNEEGKPYKSSGGKMVFNEELKKEIPEGWTVEKLEDMLEILKDGTHNPPKRIEYGIPLLTGTMFGKNFLDYKEATYISKDDYEKIHATYAPKENDLIITKIGTLGNVNYITKEDIPLAIHCNSALLRFKKQYKSVFPFLLLKSDEFQLRMKALKGKSIQEFISLNKLGSIVCLIPDTHKIERFENYLNGIFEKMKAIRKENEELTKLRDELLPLLMNGQVGFKE